MRLFSDGEIKRLQKRFADGISSQAIVESVKAKGARFSEATLRKYVQLGLLPKSHRVGHRGRHRGSTGVYPVIVLELINEIKAALDTGATLDEVRFGRVALGGEVNTLRLTAHRVMDRFDQAIARWEDSELKRELDQHRRSFESATNELEQFVARVGRRPVRTSNTLRGSVT